MDFYVDEEIQRVKSFPTWGYTNRGVYNLHFCHGFVDVNTPARGQNSLLKYNLCNVATRCLGSEGIASRKSYSNYQGPNVQKSVLLISIIINKVLPKTVHTLF